jgi:hypothetical protein
MPVRLIRHATAAVLLLAGCSEPRQPAASAPDLSGYRSATVVFLGIGPAMLQETAANDLHTLGFQLIDEQDPHLADQAVAAQTLWFRFQLVRDLGGTAVTLVVRDHAGADRFSSQAKRPELSRAIDAVVADFAPCHPAPQAAPAAAPAAPDAGATAPPAEPAAPAPAPGTREF